MNRCIVSALAAFALAAPAAQGFVTMTAAGGKLVIQGDGAADAVTLEGLTAVGEVRTRVGLGFWTTFSGIRSIKVKLGAGDDSLNVHGLAIGGDLKVQMGEGEDFLRIDKTTTLGPALSVFIGGDVQASMGGQQGDRVEIDSPTAATSLQIGGTLRLRGAPTVDIDGGGGTSSLEVDDVTIGGSLIVEEPFAEGVAPVPCLVDLDDVNVGGDTDIELDGGGDTVEITDSQFARGVEIRLGGGDDLLFMGGNPNRFDDLFSASGQGGTDAVDDDPGHAYASPPVFKGFETVL